MASHEADIGKSLLREFYSAELERIELLRNECCFVLYGAAHVGKSYLLGSLDGSTDVIDCTQMGTLVTTLETVDTLLDYLQLRLNRVLDDPSPSKLVVFDNV